MFSDAYSSHVHWRGKEKVLYNSKHNSISTVMEFLKLLFTCNFCRSKDAPLKYLNNTEF